ncbi:3'-5' exonuclease [Photobacterium sanctipauli]|uniref:3'-5' exonuclease n=1 Tax=Photobacterium sanctipauli TaxID=1342794 RepID=A0A2T3NW51_9GAMM|nr:3'-5' exonuclease [Photobacterium sanctipauli]PSW20507.1 3'-5' exonuclease [Photobacterium sanctipauli]
MKQLFSRFKSINRLEKARLKWLEQVQGKEGAGIEALPTEINAISAVSWPEKSKNFAELEFLLLDFETTGLSPETDNILSIGYVELKGGTLDLNTSHETYIKDSSGINALTAVINQITPEMLKQGQSLDEAMSALFERMKGKVVVVHGLSVERGFIDQYMQDKFGISFPPTLWLDTLQIEKSMAVNMHNKRDGDYRLSSIRERYGLPEYPCHGALIDAVATGELFLVMMKKMFGTETPQLHQIYDAVHYEMTVSG